jgi:cell division transport system permease protein
MNWLNQHLQAFKLVLSRMDSNKLSTFMISLVIAVAMAIPGVFYLGVEHLSKLSNHMQNETEISLFVKLDEPASTLTAIDAALKSNPAIQTYTKADAWEDLKAKAASSKINSEVQNLEQNPLPDAFFIQAKSADAAALATLRDELQALPGVEQALLNAEWAKRLSSILALGTKIIAFIAALLALALLVIIGNTVRMQILTQKDEIVVSKLIGATTNFIRTPFLYAGMVYGLFGGLLSMAMLMFIVQLYNQSVAQLSQLYSNDFSLAWFNPPLYLGIILLSIFIGWLGSFLSVSRAIAAIKID